MIDYKMTIILNAALDLKKTPESIDSFKKIVREIFQEDARQANGREKYWQEKAGELAAIANWIYYYVDEKEFSKDVLDECHEKMKIVSEYIEFQENE